MRTKVYTLMLVVMLIFSITITIGFVFELGKNALRIPSKQNSIVNIDPSFRPPLGERAGLLRYPSQGWGPLPKGPPPPPHKGVDRREIKKK